jgi:hypothetical protein
VAINVMTWVWGSSRSKLSARLVLLAIADYANGEDGDGAWPGIKTLATKANISVTAVHAALKTLVELGELEIIYGGGKRTPNGPTNAYRVIMRTYPSSTSPDITDGDDPRSGTPTESVPRADSAPVPDQHGYGFGTPAVSAPLPNWAEGVPISADGVPNPGRGGTDSVPRTVLKPPTEPSVNRPGSPPADGPPDSSPHSPAETPPAHAGTVVSAYVDGAIAAQQPEPTASLKARVGKQARAMLAEGTPIGRLTTAAWRMGAAGWNDLGVQVQRDAATANGNGQRPGGGGRQYQNDTPSPTSVEEMLA